MTAGLARSLPAPTGDHRAMVRPLRTFAARRRALAVPIATPLLQLHGHRVVPNAGHFRFREAPHEMAARVAAWLA